ncbi:hypothetical protein HM1_3099 [Heliomicrobium modesticaldum Ice1]|uniref:Uncharacterized protein n=1 Tax=Heliobacterium modesticaldum (strain ATCC 51547 / Ice1) TaxID=498761 RepID=B0TEB8_HELMI|nr:hypothetical protein HM1_3099 [Heliomicrobium modesticaldum Ice1]
MRGRGLITPSYSILFFKAFQLTIEIVEQTPLIVVTAAQEDLLSDVGAVLADKFHHRHLLITGLCAGAAL